MGSLWGSYRPASRISDLCKPAEVSNAAARADSMVAVEEMVVIGRYFDSLAKYTTVLRDVTRDWDRPEAHREDY